MIELSKYMEHVIAAYSITVVILIFISLGTLIDFKKTKKKLENIPQKKVNPL